MVRRYKAPGNWQGLFLPAMYKNRRVFGLKPKERAPNDFDESNQHFRTRRAAEIRPVPEAKLVNASRGITLR